LRKRLVAIRESFQSFVDCQLVLLLPISDYHYYVSIVRHLQNIVPLDYAQEAFYTLVSK
jgi:hypothetical protein